MRPATQAASLRLLVPVCLPQMSWHPQYRSSKFRHVFGKPASKENCYDSVPITHSVHDNHFCAVNPHFIAVVTECAGGGAFLVIPLHQVRSPGEPRPRGSPEAAQGRGKVERACFLLRCTGSNPRPACSSRVTLNKSLHLRKPSFLHWEKYTSPGISAVA